MKRPHRLPAGVLAKGGVLMANGFGSCLYYWNGRAWVGPQAGCYPNCHCTGAPPVPPPGTPPFYEAVPCEPNSGQAKKGEAGKPVLRIHHSPDVEIQVIHVPRRPRPAKKAPKRGAKKKS
jgi:hypothetical protein